MSRPVLLLGTGNPDKVREIAHRLAGLDLTVLSARDVAIPEVVEDRPTLEGNAIKKATEIARATGHLTLADDTGLEVDALGGAPGVRSARYAGPDCSYADNNAHLLAELSEVPAQMRTARFRTVVAVADPGGLRFTVEGVREGRIALALSGTDGFGYDPLFELPELGVTYAELSLEEKNRTSHRARALDAFVQRLPEVLPGG